MNTIRYIIRIMAFVLLSSVTFNGCSDDQKYDKGKPEKQTNKEIKAQSKSEPVNSENYEHARQKLFENLKNLGIDINEPLNVKELNLKFTSLSNLEPLKEFSGLEKLDLTAAVSFSDYSFMRYLPNLKVLNLQTNEQLDDLSPFVHLKKLTYLNISHASVSDLNPLINCPELEELDLSFTWVSDLTPLENLKKLKKLILWGTVVSDLSPLSELTNLEVLNSWQTKVSDLTPMSACNNLVELNLEFSLVRDISPLRDLKNLVKLNLSHTEVEDISPSEDMSNLTELNLFETPIKNIGKLIHLQHLRKLIITKGRISENQIKKITQANPNIDIRIVNEVPEEAKQAAQEAIDMRRKYIEDQTKN